MTAHALLFTIVCDVFLATIGAICLIWPKKIQTFVISHEGDAAFYHPLKSLKSHVRTRYYLFELRVIGSLSTVASGFLTISLVRSLLRH
jgi:hypothetical protein